jgi:flavin reductase (DIM6/NTAB) family NADH-FMN oxidoreductase RutF
MSSAGFASVKFDNLSRAERYYFMTSTIVPRPIAIVGTQDEQGRDNLAPFSYFNAVSSDPACVMFSMGKKRDRQSGALNPKDTLANILKHPEFVVHIAHASQVGIVDAAGEELEYGESERAKLGLTLVDSTWIKIHRVLEFPVAMECVLEKTVEFGTNTMVIGRVLGAHLREDLKLDGKWEADFSKLDPLARLAREYGAIHPIK